MAPHHHHEHHEHEHEHETSPEGAGYLVRLGELDYELEEGSPDVLGWDVVDRSGDVFGRIEDLLVDMNSGQILFGIVSYKMDDVRGSTLVPLAGTQADGPNKRLALPMDAASVKEAPVLEDDTEDVQPYFEYWMDKINEWASAGEEEEVESEQTPPIT